jgi:hypothetical protein
MLMLGKLNESILPFSLFSPGTWKCRESSIPSFASGKFIPRTSNSSEEFVRQVAGIVIDVNRFWLHDVTQPSDAVYGSSLKGISEKTTWYFSTWRDNWEEHFSGTVAFCNTMDTTQQPDPDCKQEFTGKGFELTSVFWGIPDRCLALPKVREPLFRPEGRMRLIRKQ